MSQLTQALKEIVIWLRVNYPEAISKLRPGLTIEEINKITKGFPFTLLKEIYELY